MPEITVLMPVRNGEKYIREAVDSVLHQSFEDFELLIMDDGSTDRTVEILRSYQDPRIRLEIREPHFIRSLNGGLSLSKGDYIARMDADDRMHIERLRIQLKRMKQKPEITVCASWTTPFVPGGAPLKPVKTGEYLIERPILKMLKGNFIAHPSVMIRKRFLEENRLTYQDYPCAEDYKLWFDTARLGGKFFIEPQSLLYFRISDSQVTSVNREQMIRQSILIKDEILDYLLEKVANKTLLDLRSNMDQLRKDCLVSPDIVFALFYTILQEMDGSVK
ncbi:MAG: glycosyltransferase [Bacteroidales bacterium]|jgi:glycosyltransferase involved in cell wall biosynthesis|nr:glycosyltransferase [Bacteroidales bacterium]